VFHLNVFLFLFWLQVIAKLKAGEKIEEEEAPQE
jgi:hypothetical protein